MSTNTLKTSFSTTVSDFLVNHVATHLSDWLQNNKEVECTPEELCTVFGCSYTPRTGMVGLPQSANMPTQMPNLPGYFQGTGASPTLSGKGGGGGGKGGGRKKSPVDPNGPKCVYAFQRGNKKGDVCGDPVAGSGQVGGDQYCKNCLKKKTVQSKVVSGPGGRSTVQPPVVPNGMVSINDDEDEDGEETATDNTLNVVPIQGQPNMFKELNHGFIVRQEQDGTIVALYVEDNGNQRSLTADEKRTAQVLGLSFLDSPQVSVSAKSVPTIPTVPSVSNHSVPTIPTVPQVVTTQ